MGLRMGVVISPCFFAFLRGGVYDRPSLNGQHNSPVTFSMASNVVEMVWDWSSLWPFPHTDTHTHTFRSTSGSWSTSQPPSPSLASPPWTAPSCSLDGWHKRITDTRYKWGLAPCMWESCDLLLKVMWLAFEGHVTYMWQILDPICEDIVTWIEGQGTGMWRPCDLHASLQPVSPDRLQ